MTDKSAGIRSLRESEMVGWDRNGGLMRDGFDGFFSGVEWRVIVGMCDYFMAGVCMGNGYMLLCRI